MVTHRDLCLLAVNWLRRPASQGGPGCNIAASECTGSYNGEIADAIGFRNIGDDQFSVVIEVKVTRSDFLADTRKPHRIGEVVGMGTFRYYLAPKETIRLSELPQGWGLIEVTRRGAPKVICGHVIAGRDDPSYENWKHDHNVKRETALLVRLLERVGDVDSLQRSLKLARTKLSQAQTIIERQNKELRSITEQYWKLKQQIDDSSINTAN